MIPGDKDRIFITKYLDKRRSLKKTNLFPLCVRIKHGEQTKLYRTGLAFPEEEYKKIIKGRRLTEEEKEKHKLINGALDRAIRAATQPFSFSRFERSWYNKQGKVDVYKYFREYIHELTAQTSFSTAEIYRNSLNALMQFCGKATLPFDKVTPKFLLEFSTWMQGEEGGGKSLTTVSLYIRSIRTVFNQARRNHDTSCYPFSNKSDNPDGFKIPNPKKGKVPLTDEELEKLKNYNPPESQKFWLDIFMFSYYAGGMNIRDVALLESKKLVNGVIYFTRSKTARKNPQEGSIPLTPEALEIVERWKSKGKYLFPLLTDSSTSEQIHKTVKSKVRNINKVMKDIAKKLGIETSISCFTARHTFANRLSQMSAPLALISQSLQHSSIKTTENYLSSFPDKQKREWFKKL